LAAAGAGLAAGGLGAPAEGSGTAWSAFGLVTVNGVWHFGHLIDRPATGMRLSSSSYTAGHFGQLIFMEYPLGLSRSEPR
jgi:hypothetical protein